MTVFQPSVQNLPQLFRSATITVDSRKEATNCAFIIVKSLFRLACAKLTHFREFGPDCFGHLYYKLLKVFIGGRLTLEYLRKYSNSLRFFHFYLLLC